MLFKNPQWGVVSSPLKTYTYNKLNDIDFFNVTFSVPKINELYYITVSAFGNLNDGEQVRYGYDIKLVNTTPIEITYISPDKPMSFCFEKEINEKKIYLYSDIDKSATDVKFHFKYRDILYRSSNPSPQDTFQIEGYDESKEFIYNRLRNDTHIPESTSIEGKHFNSEKISVLDLSSHSNDYHFITIEKSKDNTNYYTQLCFDIFKFTHSERDLPTTIFNEGN